MAAPLTVNQPPPGSWGSIPCPATAVRVVLGNLARDGTPAGRPRAPPQSPVRVADSHCQVPGSGSAAELPKLSCSVRLGAGTRAHGAGDSTALS
jgi:hypothetical protein